MCIAPLPADLAHKFSISESLTRCIQCVEKADRRGGVSRGQASPVGVRSRKGLHKCVARLFVGRKPNESVSASGLLFEAQWQLDKLETRLLCLSKAF